MSALVHLEDFDLEFEGFTLYDETSDCDCTDITECSHPTKPVTGETMPKLHGYRERIIFNQYDCVTPRQASPSARLFGCANIGTLHKTNIVVPAVFPPDQTAIVGNWYARTNIDTSMPEWKAWTHATTVTLDVGTRPLWQLSLHDLMQRREDTGGNVMAIDPFFAASSGEQIARTDSLARGAYRAYCADSDAMPYFDTLSKREQAKWGLVGMTLLENRYDFMRVVIPVRQNYSVQINAEPRSTGALVERMATNVAPQSLVWIHLEGSLSRDVA